MEDEDRALRPSQPPEEAGKLLWLIARQVDATTAQSAQLERNSACLERLEQRLALQPGAPLLIDPRTLVVRTILVAGVAALVGACTAFWWVGL